MMDGWIDGWTDDIGLMTIEGCIGRRKISEWLMHGWMNNYRETGGLNA